MTPRPRLLVGSALATGLLLVTLPAAAERPLPEWSDWEAGRLIELGEAALIRQDFPLALRLGERAVELRPEQAQAWSFLTRSGLRVSDYWPRARVASTQWLSLAPKDPLALLLAAQAQVVGEDIAAAAPLFRSLAAVSPDDPAGPLGLALCAGRLGKWAEMEGQLREALRRSPKLPLAGLALEADWAFLARSEAGIEVLEQVLSGP